MIAPLSCPFLASINGPFNASAINGDVPRAVCKTVRTHYFRHYGSFHKRGAKLTIIVIIVSAVRSAEKMAVLLEPPKQRFETWGNQFVSSDHSGAVIARQRPRAASSPRFGRQWRRCHSRQLGMGSSGQSGTSCFFQHEFVQVGISLPAAGPVSLEDLDLLRGLKRLRCHLSLLLFLRRGKVA